jgi:hypothetical protein
MERYLPLQVIRQKVDWNKLLFARAFRIVPGMDYNEVSDELREKNRGTSFQLYEVILDEKVAWEYLRDEIYPALARYLKAKAIDPRIGKRVIISLFFRDQFYLIEYPEFTKVYCEMEGLEEKDFRLHISKWLSENNS